jgi:hypothetical protein
MRLPKDSNNQEKYFKTELQTEGIFRLIEAILLQVLDKVLVSGKWTKRDISLATLEKKLETLKEMEVYLKSDNWDIWVRVYSDYYKTVPHNIKRNFEKLRKKSEKLVRERIKSKLSMGNT